MFNYAPSEVFAPDMIPKPPNDFYMESVQFSSNEEDLTISTGVNVRIADFGTCENTFQRCVFMLTLYKPAGTISI